MFSIHFRTSLPGSYSHMSWYSGYACISYLWG